MTDEERATSTIAADTTSASVPPAAPDGQLSDEDLSKVAGGAGSDMQAVSNIEKTRHDTAMNTIRNMT